MGDVIPFPEGGRRGRPSPPQVSVMYCTACGKERHWPVSAADPGPCSCGGHTFQGVQQVGALHMQSWASVPGVELVSPGPTVIPWLGPGPPPS